MERDVIICGGWSPESFEKVKGIDVHDSVDQYGFVDLVDAFTHGSIPSDIVASDTAYNGIDDPASILGKSKDVFSDALVRQSIADYKAPDKKVE